MFGVIFSLARPLNTAVALGAIVALSSTVVVLRVLADRSELDSIRGRSALGILLLQDIAVVPLLVVVSMLGSDTGGQEVTTRILLTLAAAAGLAALFYVLFYMIVPRLLFSKGLMRNRELVVLLGIISAIGSAYLAHMVGLSASLGAFLAGILLAESPFATQIRAHVGSIRTLFVTIFFTSIGMLAEPLWILKNLPLVMAGVVLIFVVKAIIVYAIARSFKINRYDSLAVGISLAQVGEFALVLGTEAYKYGHVIEKTFDLVVSITIVSFILAPYMVSFAPRLSRVVIDKLAPRRPLSTKPGIDEETPECGRIFIIGFGPAGQRVAEEMSDYQHLISIIDLNPHSVNRAQSMGFRAMVGDATHEDVLETAGVENAQIIVVTVPDPKSSVATIELVRSLSPDAIVIVRARYHYFMWEFEKVGASAVVDEEDQIGRTLASVVIGALEGQSVECGPDSSDETIKTSH